MDSHTIRILLNGEAVEAAGLPPTTSLLAWLRTQRGLTGTKEGCAEGDCGACTVVVGELRGTAQALHLASVNACIQFLPALDGKAVFTVEYLRAQAGGRLHPVQQAMVDCHGSQCGFCTPGFVMSLWDLYNDCAQREARATPGEVRSALTGNLCRCTGYRPILEAGEHMFELPAVALDREALRHALLALQREDVLDYRHGSRHFLAPRSVAGLADLRAARPNAVLLAGCTDIGLWVNKQLRELDDILYLGRIEALRQITAADGWLHIGAAVTLTEAFAALTHPWPELAELWARFGSPPVRNAGTLGGNIANGSPIGDSMPALIALGARIVLRSVRGTRELALEDFYLDYMKKDLAADEFLEAVRVPLRPGAVRAAPGDSSPHASAAANKDKDKGEGEGALHFRCWKLSKRFDSDISALCAAFAIRVRDGIVVAARVAFGGMAATPRRAAQTEAALLGQPWDAATLARAQAALAADYTPLDDLRASAAYRRRAAANLLQRFHLETRPEAPLPAQQTRAFAGVADKREAIR
jgi:xanthine dehydrogenase small subunit